AALLRWRKTGRNGACWNDRSGDLDADGANSTAVQRPLWFRPQLRPRPGARLRHVVLRRRRRPAEATSETLANVRELNPIAVSNIFCKYAHRGGIVPPRTTDAEGTMIRLRRRRRG